MGLGFRVKAHFSKGYDHRVAISVILRVAIAVRSNPLMRYLGFEQYFTIMILNTWGYK